MEWGSLLPILPDAVSRTIWYIRLRWILIAALAIPAIFSLYVGEGWSIQVQRDTQLAAIAAFSNAIFYIVASLAEKQRTFKQLSFFILAADILFVSALIFIKGGIESRSVILYVMPVLMTAVMFGRKFIHLTSFICVLIYSSILILDYHGVVTTIGSYSLELHFQLAYMVNTIIFFGLIIGIIGVLTDLILQYQVLALESVQSMKLAQTLAKLGSWELDAERNALSWPNELDDLFQTALSENPASYEDLISITHKEDRKYFDKEFKKALRNKREFSIEHRIVGRDKKIRHAQTEGKPITNRQGDVNRVLGTSRDETSDKALEESRAEFVALASHQLRTPATAVKQYLGILLDDKATTMSGADRELIQEAYQNNERQIDIIDALLDVARMDSGKMELELTKVNITSLVKSIVSEHKPILAMKHQQLILEDSKKISIIADSPKLRMAIDNIVNNASKYSPSGTDITIGLSVREKELDISVTDSGIGVTPLDVNKLFQKFSRLESPLSKKVNGTGLGLYLASKVVSMHGGNIEVIPHENEGTTFRIALPRRN